MTIRQIINSINKKEWHFVVIVVVIMLLLNFLPPLYGYLNAPDGYFYRGIHAFVPNDYSVYFSYIDQVKDGNFWLKNNFTSESQIGILNFFWLAVGLLARILNLSALAAFQLFRFLLIPLFLVIAYIFISYFWQNKAKRKIAYLFLCFSSGVGVYYVFFTFWSANYKLWPIDLWVTGSNVFLSLYHSPHYVMSLIMMLLFILFFLLALANLKFFYSFWAGIIGLFWFNFHPYFFISLAVMFLVYTLILIIKNKNINYLWHFGLIFLLSSPFIIYHYYLIQTDLVIGLRASQNITRLPSFLYVLLGYGWLFVCSIAILANWLINKKLQDNKKLFLLIWFLTSLFLIYSPFNFTSKFLFGWQIAMSILTVYFLVWLKNLIQLKKNKFFLYIYNNKSLICLIIFSLFGLSVFFNILRDVVYYKDQYHLFYLPNEYRQAFSWLEENNQNDKVILSNDFNGNIIPGFINQTVFLGHGHETIDHKQKKFLTQAYFNHSLSLDKEMLLLKNNNIGYVFINKNQPEFADKEYLQEVFNQGNIIIYKITDL